MKTLGLWMLTIFFMAAVNTAGADDGETIFTSLGCTACHKKESKSKVNPSLAEIAQTYQGKEAQLESYLKGEAASIIRPEKAGMMKRQLEKTKKLSDADRKALADYLLQQP
jgi:cytochrome c551/c552